MNKQQTLSNTTQIAPPIVNGTDQSRDEMPVLLDRALERFIVEEKWGDGPVHFKNANDVKKYMAETGQIPVVRKLKGKPRSDRKHHPADDYFELVESFPTYEEAQQFIEGKLSLLIWSVPAITAPKMKTQKRGAA